MAAVGHEDQSRPCRLSAGYRLGEATFANTANSSVHGPAINGERFRAYVEQMLAPRLRPDDIVLMDSLTSEV